MTTATHPMTACCPDCGRRVPLYVGGTHAKALRYAAHKRTDLAICGGYLPPCERSRTIFTRSDLSNPAETATIES